MERADIIGIERADRLDGEWFAPSVALISYIDDRCRPPEV